MVGPSLEETLAMPEPVVPFGRPMREGHFLFAPTYTPLNHGSFGTYPQSVRDDFHHWQARSEARPDSWVRYDYPRQLDSSINAVASLLNLPAADIVLVKNASTAINTVLRSLRFVEGDVILHLSTVYGANAKTIEYLRETTPVDSESLSVQYPIGDDELVQTFTEGVERIFKGGQNVRIAIFDTISSMPGVRVPWERLVEKCSALGVLSMVDGAHGVGHVELDLRKHQPDFFVSNLHKWLLVPRSCAVFYVPQKNQHVLRSALPTSHGFVPVPKEGATVIPDPLSNRKLIDSPFQKLFRYVATSDDTSYLCIESALKFRRDICGGEERIRAHNTHIAVEGGKLMAAILGTECMEEAGKLERCFFANIRLPLTIGEKEADVAEKSVLGAAEWIVEKLVDDFDMYMAIYVHAGQMWARISGQIYIELADVERGGLALKAICTRVQAKEHLQDINGAA